MAGQEKVGHEDGITFEDLLIGKVEIDGGPAIEAGAVALTDEEFERRVKRGLEECGRWLTEHAGELARSFSGGCQGWSVEFADGVEGCPEIRVRVNEVDRGVMDVYFLDKGVIDAYFCGREEG